ncbi:nucleoside recognition domain-containing protein [Hathewaya histolytica]|uniref:Uncharacterized protein conserved in bacteria n=1 Tax=Hathewaya histolytica TaxID=1498 RepID=A0A4U9RQR3_HATHI|nr:nucleoside recognition domain-containing protein [Hathewaya histolytica]VTQ93906.1 Uncharacterized protein conserved in bacteria [Hathewaya histolytica]
MSGEKTITKPVEEKKTNQKKIVKVVTTETYVAFAVIAVLFWVFASRMGVDKMFKTMMGTAHDLILNTIWFLMGVIVLAGAFTSLLSEFGIVAIINKVLYPLMKPLYGLPGAASVGAVTTYLSDNPSIVPIVQDKGFLKYFKKYQIPSLVNFGTVFGMGLIVTTFMLAQSSDKVNLGKAVLIGNIAALTGGILSVRLMLIVGKKRYGTEQEAVDGEYEGYDMLKYREVREGNVTQRVLQALLDGGKTGVDTALTIIPGVVIMCTFIMMLSKGPGPNGVFTGAAYEGIGFFPWIGSKLQFIIKPLFGFSNSEAITFPITSLASVGASLAVVPEFLKAGIINAKDVAVFTAMAICNAGFLSVHVGLMDAIGERDLVNKAIITQLLGGIASGILANILYMIF